MTLLMLLANEVIVAPLSLFLSEPTPPPPPPPMIGIGSGGRPSLALVYPVAASSPSSALFRVPLRLLL
jgi:hypothetical protein